MRQCMNLLQLRLKLSCFCFLFQMSVAALLPRKVQELFPHQQSLSPARSVRVCLVTCRSAAAGRVMRGSSPSSLCRRRCSLSHRSLTHPNEGKARVTRRRWRWEMIRFRAKAGGGMKPSLRMTLSAVRVMRYVCSRGETCAHCTLNPRTCEVHLTVCCSDTRYVSLTL